MKDLKRVGARSGVFLALLSTLVAAPLPAQQAERVLDHDAYDVWKTIRGERISDDGQWVLYHLALRVGDAELVVTRPGGGAEYRIDRATNARFSPDSRHVVFTIEPAHDSVRALRLAETKRSEMPVDTLGILTLATGAVTRIADGERWALPEDDGAFVVYMTDGAPADSAAADSAAAAAPEVEPGVIPEVEPEPEPEVEPGAELEQEPAEPGAREKPETSTLVVRDLATGVERRLRNAVSYVVARNGARVVYTASSEDGAADGVYSLDPLSGAVTTIAAGEALYRELAVSEDGRQVAFLTDREGWDGQTSSYAVHHWRAGSDGSTAVVPTVPAGIPTGWWVSEHGSLRFSESGDRLFFGTAPRPAPEADADTLLDEEEVELDVWHWQDPLLQPMQLLQADRERRRTYEAVVHLGRRNRVVQLETPELPSVRVGREGDADVALAVSDVAYRHLIGIESPGYDDVWLIDVRDGSRRQVLENDRVAWASLSPEAKYLAWYDYDDRRWLAMETGGDRIVDLSAGIPHPIWDEEDDHPMAPGPYGLAGWTEDDDHILIYDRFDIWAVDPDGRSTPRRITEGYGRENGIELRYERLDPDEESIDPDEPMLLEAFGVRTKQAGYFRDRVEGSRRPEQLVYEPKRFGGLTLAEDSDRLLYTREDVAEFPDLWVADTDFGGARKVSDANPQQSAYNWATVELVEWLSSEGVPLQGLLYRPEDFDPSRSYPMMVYFYEKNSDNLHAHAPPLPHRSVIQPTFYASRGYLVFIPDIVYRDGFPGESAMDAVMPGVLKLAAEPWVDETNVGVQGHSWGGYQIAYMVTRTDFFKAAEAGAPVANMTSAYGGIRWGSGMSRIFQYERTQSRIGESLWDNRMRYIENSPLFFLDRVETPLLIMHNDEDTAVPWYQGIELFMGLRRLGKPAWLINYNDQPHWPVTAANIRDWNIRMQQFFDHYLQGAPAPRWLVEGIPATEKGRSLGLDLVEETGPITEPDSGR